MNLKPHRIFSLALVMAALLGAVLPAAAQSEPRRILVTLAQASAEPLTAVELDLRINKKPAEVTRVFQPQERPVQLAVLIDDSVSNSLPDLPEFVRSLPVGSEVLVAYVRAGSLQVAQPFTTNFRKAADAVRIPSGSPSAAPPSLGQTILDALVHFPAGGAVRAQILYVGEGHGDIDPHNDVPLNRAVAEAQTRGVPVWVIRVRMTRREPTGLALTKLSQETGGQAFAMGLVPPTFAPDELRGLLDRQYLVEFTPPTDKNGEPVAGKLTLQVRGRKEARLLYPAR